MRVNVFESENELLATMRYEEAYKDFICFPCVIINTSPTSKDVAVNSNLIRAKIFNKEHRYSLSDVVIHINTYISDIDFIRSNSKARMDTEILDIAVNRHLEQCKRLRKLDYFTLIDQVTIVQVNPFEEGSMEVAQYQWNRLNDYGLKKYNQILEN
jgi:hypothetical protein